MPTFWVLRSKREQVGPRGHWLGFRPDMTITEVGLENQSHRIA